MMCAGIRLTRGTIYRTVSDMATTLTPLIRTKSRAQQLIERRIGEPIEQALHRLYVVEQQQQDEIAVGWGIDRATVSRWMTQFDIETRITGPRRVSE